jgi:hypothetical protein
LIPGFSVQTFKPNTKTNIYINTRLMNECYTNIPDHVLLQSAMP